MHVSLFPDIAFQIFEIVPDVGYNGNEEKESENRMYGCRGSAIRKEKREQA
jgi:hypothetical protein